MTKFKIGDRVKVLYGLYRDCEGQVIAERDGVLFQIQKVYKVRLKVGEKVYYYHGYGSRLKKIKFNLTEDKKFMELFE